MKARKKLADLVFRYIVFLFTIVTVIAVIMIGVYMFRSGGPSIAKVGIKNFLFGKTWDTSVEPAKYGIFSFLSASVISMLGTVIVTVPVSILTAVGMSHFIPRPIASVLRTVISMLAGIPSVIYGFLGMILLVPFVQELFKLPAGLTLLSAIVVLVVMTLPTIISVSESSITAVPKDYMEASLALGVYHPAYYYSGSKIRHFIGHPFGPGTGRRRNYGGDHGSRKCGTDAKTSGTGPFSDHSHCNGNGLRQPGNIRRTDGNWPGIVCIYCCDQWFVLCTDQTDSHWKALGKEAPQCN